MSHYSSTNRTVREQTENSKEESISHYSLTNRNCQRTDREQQRGIYLRLFFNQQELSENRQRTSKPFQDKDIVPVMLRKDFDVLQYGFVTMFVAAFPLAPLFAWLNNIIEIRLDATNFIRNFRRPVAQRAEDIGAWYYILDTLTKLSVWVNACVLAFTSELIPKLVYVYKYSPDGSLKGYVNNSLSHFNVSDFKASATPDNATKTVPYTLPFCRYPGYHEPNQPYEFSKQYWIILTARLAFIILFQQFVSITTRLIAYVVPDIPKTLELKIKRENIVAAEVIRKHKEKVGLRKPHSEQSTGNFNVLT